MVGARVTTIGLDLVSGLVSGYAHVFILLSVVIVSLPIGYDFVPDPAAELAMFHGHRRLK